MEAIKPLLIAQVMRCAAIIRDSSNTNMLSFANTFGASCAIHTADIIEQKPSTLTKPDLTNPMSISTSTKDSYQCSKQAGTTLTNLESGRHTYNTSEQMDRDVMLTEPLIAPEYLDSKPFGEQIMEIFTQLLTPMDIWDGSDTSEAHQESLHELHKSIFALDPNIISPESESDCIFDTTVSLTSLAMLDDEEHKYPAIQKEQYVSAFNTESSPIQHPRGTHAPMKALPFKKRSFLTTPSESLGGVRHECTKVGVSLNELQLQRIGKFLESKNKKLKVGPLGSTTNSVPTSCLSYTQDSDPFFVGGPCSLNEDIASTQRDIETPPQHDDSQPSALPIQMQNEFSIEVNDEIDLQAEQKEMSTECLERQSGYRNQGATEINVCRRQTQKDPDALTPCTANVDVWDEETFRQVDESVAMSKSFQNTPSEDMIPLNPVIFFHVFVSTPIQRDVHQYIVNTIPPPFPARRYILLIFFPR
jgi:hypothetical protein